MATRQYPDPLASTRVAGREEPCRSVQIAAIGERDLHGVRSQATPHPILLARHGAHKQPRVVSADRVRSNQDGIYD